MGKDTGKVGVLSVRKSDPSVALRSGSTAFTSVRNNFIHK